MVPSNQKLTVAEVAAELRCTRVTIYRLMASGDLPYVQMSERTRRVTREQLDKFIQSRSVN